MDQSTHQSTQMSRLGQLIQNLLFKIGDSHAQVQVSVAPVLLPDSSAHTHTTAHVYLHLPRLTHGTTCRAQAVIYSLVVASRSSAASDSTSSADLTTRRRQSAESVSVLQQYLTLTLSLCFSNVSERYKVLETQFPYISWPFRC